MSTKLAIRTFARLWAPISESFDEANQVDHGFDAGEFGGPASANAELAEYEALADRIGPRFGLTGPEVMAAYEAHVAEDGYHWMRAQMSRSRSA